MPKKQGHSGTISKEKKQAAWIEAYFEHGRDEKKANKQIGITRNTLCRWKQEDAFLESLRKRVEQIALSVNTDISEMVQICEATIRRGIGLDPEFALSVAERLYPERWNKNVVQALWAKANEGNGGEFIIPRVAVTVLEKDDSSE